MLDQVHSPKVVVADLYDYWIENTRPGLTKLLERIQILLCSDSEARILSGEHNLVKAGRAILKMGPGTVLIKRGEYGVLQFSKEGMFAVPAYPLEEVVDPTGAGDTFAGAMMGFLARHGRITESSLRTAVVYGSVVASFVVERFSLERLLDLTLGRNRPSLSRVYQSDRFSSFEMDYSVVIPLYNERDSLAPLHVELTRVMQSLGRAYELIFVDDGSIDGSIEALRQIKSADQNVRVISLGAQLGTDGGAGVRIHACDRRRDHRDGRRRAKRSRRHPAAAGQARRGLRSREWLAHRAMAGGTVYAQAAVNGGKLADFGDDRSEASRLRMHLQGVPARSRAAVCSSTARCIDSSRRSRRSRARESRKSRLDFDRAAPASRSMDCGESCARCST